MYYVIIDGALLLAEQKENLSIYYDNVKELPIDYEQGKYIVVGNELVLNDKYEEEKEAKEKERIAKLHLTGADVERGIYKAKGMDFDDIIAFVIANPPKELDVKALKIELKANNFYRGNPYVEVVGKMLGFTDGQLNMFFETNDYLYLTNCTLIIKPTPVEATVTINDVIGNKITVPFSTALVWSVSAEGYKSQDGGLNIKENTNLDIVLEKEEVVNENTTDKSNTVQDEATVKASKRK